MQAPEAAHASDVAGRLATGPVPGGVAVIYSLGAGLEDKAFVRLALTRLRAEADHLIVVRRADRDAKVRAALGDIGVDDWIDFADGVVSMMAAYKAGVSALPGGAAAWPRVLLTGGHAYGPFITIAQAREAMADAALFAAFHHNATLDKRLAVDGVIPRLDYALFRGDVLATPAMTAFWANMKPAADYWADFKNGAVRLAAVLAGEGGKTVYSVSPALLETAEPSVIEVHTLAAHGAAVLSKAAFFLDPLAADVSAVELRATMDFLRENHPEDYAAIIAHMLPAQELRALATNMDDYRIVPYRADNPEKTEWNFGRVAVFIHAFYVEMMPEFWALITRLPGQYDLFLTTSAADHKVAIEAFLAEKGFPADRTDVRVVEQNRGRDMSSLFISFRDVILEGRYELALRLHSKRTPQVSRRVGESFKAHLFENLVHSEGYIRNLYDELEANRDVGLVIPPAIHVGFGTMGHGWFANREPFAALAKEMRLKVPMDEHTPVAPYGTMYWFRTDALRLMFEWPWKWESYNAEPNHVDGGLAHVQERLIAYCAQQAGYRTLSVMTPDNAARNYAKLEYKMQLLASQLPHGGAVFDRAMIAGKSQGVGARAYDSLAPMYFRAVKRAPWVRTLLRPFIHFIERHMLGRAP
ncbi:MAG: rhamnan synthesis F family protein [Pikeienuella sp.]